MISKEYYVSFSDDQFCLRNSGDLDEMPHYMWHLICVSTVCLSTSLGVSGPQRVKTPIKLVKKKVTLHLICLCLKLVESSLEHVHKRKMACRANLSLTFPTNDHAQNRKVRFCICKKNSEHANGRIMLHITVE